MSETVRSDDPILHLEPDRLLGPGDVRQAAGPVDRDRGPRLRTRRHRDVELDRDVEGVRTEFEIEGGAEPEDRWRGDGEVAGRERGDAHGRRSDQITRGYGDH